MNENQRSRPTSIAASLNERALRAGITGNRNQRFGVKKGSVAKTGKAPGSVELHADDPGHPTIDFLLTARRDAAAARRFFRKAVSSPGNPAPRVINVDKNPAFPHAVEALKMEGILPQRVEQDHRTVKKGTWPAKGYGSLRLHGGRGKALRQWR